MDKPAILAGTVSVAYLQGLVEYLQRQGIAPEALLAHGSQAQCERWLPAMVKGSQIGCFALAEGLGNPSARSVNARVENGRLSGEKWPVSDGDAADFAEVVCAHLDDRLMKLLLVVQHAGQILIHEGILIHAMSLLRVIARVAARKVVQPGQKALQRQPRGRRVRLA